MRSLAHNICRLSLLVTLLALIITSQPLKAQESPSSPSQKYTFVFKGEPIQHALQRLVQKTDLDLIYDPSIIPDHSVYSIARKEQPEEILRAILDGSDLDFIQLSSGTYVLTTKPQQKTLTGNLAGRVIDQKTGEPLAGANVMLADANGGAATTESGRFSIPNLPTGYHPITINYVGYRPVKDTVWVPANASTALNFSMASQPVLVEPIVIDGIQKRIPAAQSLYSGLSSSQIRSPQSQGSADAIKSMDAITGINFSLPMASFNIQGGGNGDHQLQLDGVPIYNPVSMGHMLGAFSPWAIQKIKVNKAGFGSAVGSQLSGVINMVQDVGNTDNHRFMLQANPLNINGRFDQQFELDDGPSIKLMLAARTNIWRWYQNANYKQNFQNWDQLDPLLTLELLQNGSSDTIFQPLDHTYDINYYDLHATARIKHNAFHRTSISTYHGKNALSTDLFSENVVVQAYSANLFYSSDQYDWENTMAKIKHEWLASSRLDASISGYFTKHTFDHNYVFSNDHQAKLWDSPYMQAHSDLKQYARKTMTTGDQNAMVQSAVQLNLDYTVSKNYSISGGLRGNYLDYKFSLSDQYYNAASSKGNSFLVSGYLRNDFLLSSKTSLSIGNRFAFAPSRDLVFAEPRVSIKHDEAETSIGYLSGKVSGGVYRQFINQFNVSNVGPSSLVPSLSFWVPIDYTTTVPKAYHLSFNGLWEPAESWQFELESYYKWMPSRLMLDYQALSGFKSLTDIGPYSQQGQFITSSKGYAYGMGLSFSKRIIPMGVKIDGGYQFSVAEQRYPSRFGNSYQPVANNQPHKVNASINWEVLNNLTLLMQWQGVWGRSWGFRKAYYDYLSIRQNRAYGDYSFTNPGADRLPAYSQLNAGVSYQLNLGDAGLQFRFDVFNLLDRQNVLNWWLSPYRNEAGHLSYELKERTMSGLRPSFSIKLTY